MKNIAVMPLSRFFSIFGTDFDYIINEKTQNKSTHYLF